MDGPTNADGNRGVIDYSGRLLINDNIRYEIETGNVYRTGHRFAAVAAGAKVRIAFDPSLNGTLLGNAYKLKATFQSTLKPVNVEFYEDAVLSDNGTELIAYNYNRCAGCDPSLNPYAKMYHTPTVVSVGNKYGPDVYVYSTDQKEIATTGTVVDEYSVHLNQAKKYMWVFENLGADVTDIIIAVRIVFEKDYRAGGR